MTRLIPQAARLPLVLVLLLPLFAPACGARDDRTIEHEVEVLVGEPGRRADVAELRLVARGPAAILFLETALYDADPRGRRRVIRTLSKIGHREAIPILQHLQKSDPDKDTRSAASNALSKLVTKN